MYYKYVVNHQILAILYGQADYGYGGYLEIVKTFPNSIEPFQVGVKEFFYSRLNCISPLTDLEKIKYL